MRIENGSTVARWVALSLMSLLFTSCSVNQAISQVDWKNGAKLGWVVRFYGPDLAQIVRNFPSSS